MSSTHRRLIRFVSVAALICCAGLACTASMAVATTPVAPIQTSGTTSTLTSTTPAPPASPAYSCTWIANGAHKPPYGVYIRSAPSTSAPTRGVIPNGTVFGGTCNPVNGFISTTYKGTFGYVNHHYLIQVIGAPKQ
jgi:hypothetical protein